MEVVAPHDYSGISKDKISKSAAAQFEEIATLHAGRIALKAGEETLSYDELNRKSNRIAHGILDLYSVRTLTDSNRKNALHLEANPELVVVFMDQGIPAIVSVLATLKAGKVFVSVDPQDSHTRNEFILRHASAWLVLTDAGNLELAGNLAGPNSSVIDIDEIEGKFGMHNPDLAISPLDPALLIYTSGSTGRPKGVIRSQESLLHDIMNKTGLMKISPSDRMSILSWGTGQAVMLIFSAILNGASLHMYNLRREGIAHLAKWLIQERISLHTVSAPIMRSFLELLNGNGTFPDVRILRTASDVIYPDDMVRMKKHFGSHCFYINALSSNETGTICANVMTNSSPADPRGVSVGFPLEGMKIELLDEDGNKAVDSHPGTIRISSRYISDGYWKQPDLSRKLFFRSKEDPRTVSFKSGDLAKFRPDGSIELCGRSDFQVKIRGYRVDTSEVEAVLLEHENIKEAVVHPFENESGEKRLAGYVVPCSKPAPTTSSLNNYLRERLVDYMVPAAFVIMDEIPLLRNGKINRMHLPAPGRSRPVLDNDYAGARTQTEELLVEIWSKVLEIEGVGIHDQFLELGGDSLNAGQVMARIIEAFGVNLPLRQMFEASTVAKLADWIEQQYAESNDILKACSIQRQPGMGPWQLSFGQKRLWFLAQLNPDSPAYNMPKLIRIKGDLNVPALTEAIEWIVQRHEVLRTNYVTRNGIPEAFVRDCPTIELPVVDLRGLLTETDEEELESLIAQESIRRFDLEKDVMLRSILYRLGSENHVLLCLTHHIASDGWSRGLLMRELVSHYERILSGEPPSMEALPIQYSDFARWQAGQQETETLRKQLAYWIENLRGIPSSLDLPTDRPRPSELSQRGSSFKLMIPGDKSEQLSRLAQSEHVTMFMLLLTAFYALLYRYTGQKDLVVGCPVSGRKAVETENLIGFFVNTLLIRSDLSGNPSFRELLGRVREQALGAYANADVPFEELVIQMRPKRDLSRNPLFQVIFDVHRARAAGLEGGGSTFDLMDSLRQASPVDLGWNIAITGEGLRVRVEFSTDLFDTSTIERMVMEYASLLDQVLADPDIHTGSLSVRSGTEIEEHPEFMKSDLPAMGFHGSSDICSANSVFMKEIWCKVFDRDGLVPHDNFFELGGHSLTAMRLVAQARERFEVQLSVRDLFENPTMAELLSIIERRLEEGKAGT